MWNFLGKKKLSRSELIARLAENGVRLRSGRAIASDGKADVELILCELGDQEWLNEEFSESEPNSDDVWHFDTEAIEDHGAYVSIAENLARLSGGAMAGARFSDFVDIDEGVAWCEIEVGGKRDKIELTVDSDWVDPQFFVWFESHMKKLGSDNVIGIHGLYQDCLIVCKTPDEIAKLNKALGLKFSIKK